MGAVSSNRGANASLDDGLLKGRPWRRRDRIRDTAWRAFRGQDVKLREEFQVRLTLPHDLASQVWRARIALAAVQLPDHQAPLNSHGWISSDTQTLADAVAASEQADDSQESAKSGRLGGTADRDANANDLYARLLTIQNAANLQWPDTAPNTEVRAEFLLS